MLFNFLKYLQPTAYFTLRRKEDNTSIFPCQLKASDIQKYEIVVDKDFKSNYAQKLDSSWQAIQKGYITDEPTITEELQIPVEDEYRFVRKYFNGIWATYCLGIRILSFKNPFKEIKAWKLSRNVKRIPLVVDSKNNADCQSFNSVLITKAPLVSVIIPTLNRYSYLKNVLHDFEKQDYSNFELLIVDQSDNFDASFYKQFKLNIQLIRQEEKALWLARNTAIKKATGTIIALSEDDVRIASNWLTAHLKCLDFFKADISAGVFYPEGHCLPKERSFFAIAKQFATGNAMLYKKVFTEVGLFDWQFEKGRMGDGEFGLRCYLAGLKSISNPFASCIDVKAGIGGLREMGSWDAYRPTNWFAPRPVPSVLYYYRSYFGYKLALFELLKTIPPSIIPYKFKKNKKIRIVGVFISLLLLPIILFQVVRSWHLASIKLKEGAKIEKF